ncbi:nicotinamidase-related amidase [Methylobacterium brachiatum]|jgi:nicotinamidase-related amidase|uniref:Nicotinamidase-related amidase n=2 Tax=Methylobacteriaceae TaxID=119045 RepID=A0AAJ1TP15_9HYPH|nr:nicotinamidase-related amidase [Methylobacterium brachiatum]
MRVSADARTETGSSPDAHADDSRGSAAEPLGRSCMHLCVDMQRMFAEPTDWQTPWMARVLPQVRRLAEAHPDRTVFTRFIPAARPGEGRGTWATYSERWSGMTRAELDPGLIELVPDLARLVPPAAVIDKTVYSPWLESDLDARLQAQGVDTLIVTGAETDVCVLAAVLGGVDFGYRIVLATDGLCSSCDEAHDALMVMYRMRYGHQVLTLTTDEILERWP